MAFTVKCDPSYNYDDIISIMNTELDIPVINLANLPETILNILMGTRQIREGSKPSIEYQYDAIRKIKAMMELNQPVSVVIPAGPKKPGEEGDYIDLAEFWFFKILNELGNKVRSLYPAGVTFTIILEDASMEVFEPELPHHLAASYAVKLNSLIRTMEYAQNIQVIPESMLVSSSDLINVGNEVIDELRQYIYHARRGHAPNAVKAMEALLDKGWQGGISSETLDYYFQSFGKNYPDRDDAGIREAIALYLATSYARYKLNARKITDFDIIAGNAKRVPGVIFGKYNRIFYRTMPLTKTKTHIPFWRARGIIEYVNGEHVSKLYPFTLPLTTDNTVVTITNKTNSVDIRLDLLE